MTKKTKKLNMTICLSCLCLASFQESYSQELKKQAPTPAAEENLDESWQSYNPETIAKTTGTEVTKQAVVAEIFAPTTEYTYASFGKESPFIPPLLTSHFAKLEIPIVSILQRYKLNELDLVGIWTLENSARKALIMTPNMEGVTVEIGDHIGVRGGKIIRIGSDSLKVREFTLAPDGARQFDDIELSLGDGDNDSSRKIVIRSNSGVSGSEQDPESRQDFLDTTSQQENRIESIQQRIPVGQAKPDTDFGPKLPPPDMLVPPAINSPATPDIKNAPAPVNPARTRASSDSRRLNNANRGKLL